MSALQTSPAEPAWAAFAAIDWGSQNHSWCWVPATGGPVRSGQLKNTPEAVELWVAALGTEFPGGPIAIAVEQKRGAVVYMLSKYDRLVLFPVPPSMSASYRRAFRPSGAKDDAGDAALLLDLLRQHRDRLRPLAQDTDATRLLRCLVEQRRKLVQQKVRFVQQLTDAVQQYFPQLRVWFGSLDSVLVDALLERWPTLPELQRSHPGTLNRFLLAHRCRNKDAIAERIQAIHAAVPATTDAVIVEACTRKVTALLATLRVLREHIAAHDKRIAAICADHPDAPIFASFPGAGAATVPRLIAAFGTRRDTWESAADLQRLSGVAPVHISSGNSQRVVMRRCCPKFLRQTFHEFAGQSIRFSKWAKVYHLHHRGDDKKKHHRAVRALAFRWMPILYRCWKDRQLYDERLFLEAQRRRNSPLSRKLSSSPLSWATEAGFQKLAKKP
jgi:transposase